jgi:hypothetical protein
VKRPNFPAVSTLLDALGAMRPDALVCDAVQARYLHYELATVLGVAENAIFAAERAPMTIVVKREEFDLMAEVIPGAKPIPQQVREAVQATADASVDHRSAISLLDAVSHLSDADAVKLRNLLR